MGTSRPLPHSEALRAIACKYGESNDRSENSDFVLLRQKTLLVNCFQKYILKVPASSYFCEIKESPKYRSINQNRLFAKLHIFNRLVQKEGNLPKFLIHIVCNLNSYHFSEVSVIFK